MLAEDLKEATVPCCLSQTKPKKKKKKLTLHRKKIEKVDNITDPRR
jgi:hypothetical protein